MLLLCSCIVLYCSYACCMSLRMLFVLVLCIVFMHSGMEEQLCRMPEFKQINQIKSNQIKSHRTYLTNRLGSISHHITPLVINSLRGGHTNTHTQTFADRSNSKKPGVCRPTAARLV